MSWKVIALPCLALTACTETKPPVDFGNSLPTATILVPLANQEIKNGTLFDAYGTVTDPDPDHGPDVLLVTWMVGSEVKCGPMAPDPEGNTQCDVSFGWDRITIALTVEDPEGALGQDTVTIGLIEATAPVVEITAPANNADFRTDELIYFSATVSDGEDEPEGLGLWWESSEQGLLDMNHTVSSDGAVEGSILLDIGSHIIRLWATDTSGRTSGDELMVQIHEEAAAPTVTITAPADGSTYGIGDLVVFRASIGDELDYPNTLDVQWTSSIDDVIGEEGSDSPGTVELSTTTLSEGEHLISLAVTDSDEMTTTGSIVVTVESSDTGI
jgi:hypothetical protein